MERVMRYSSLFVSTTALAVLLASVSPVQADDHGHDQSVELGPRPFYLVDGMDDSWLKSRLRECKAGPFHKTDFSIGHRGAAPQFPEHTKEAYQAGARQGAGIVECDVTLTKDKQLVCRHSDCDLHTTTNIVDTPLNNECEVPWSGPNQSPAPKCCTWNLTLAQFKTLRGKMDASNAAATTPAGYLGGTASWRTDLYTGRGTLMTLRESVRLNEKLGVGHTPELTGGDVAQIQAIFGGQNAYAQALIDVLRDEGGDPRRVWLQSFNIDDVVYWVEHAPEFGRRAVYLDDVDPTDLATFPKLTPAELQQAREKGVKIIAPPLSVLLELDAQDEIVESQYAKLIKSSASSSSRGRSSVPTCGAAPRESASTGTSTRTAR
jgi:glycerophosphoryl diester phosphodiesterase